MPRAEQALLLRAWIFVWGARVLLWVAPYQWAAVRLLAAGGKKECSQASDELMALSVVRASRLVPAATCLVQALACGWMIQRAGGFAIIRFGVAKDGSGLRAHAWLESQGRILVGGGSVHEYEPLMPASGRIE